MNQRCTNIAARHALYSENVGMQEKFFACTTCLQKTLSMELLLEIHKLSWLMGASKKSEFAQMQGAEKISQRRICNICQQEIFPATRQLR